MKHQKHLRFHEYNYALPYHLNNVLADLDENSSQEVLDRLIQQFEHDTTAMPRSPIDAENTPEGYVTVSLTDNGVGMSDEQCEKLFDESTLISTPGTANEKGTGLGLKLCREFVGRMGGEIEVTSKIDEGSVFKFTLKIPGQR